MNISPRRWSVLVAMRADGAGRGRKSSLVGALFRLFGNRLAACGARGGLEIRLPRARAQVRQHDVRDVSHALGPRLVFGVHVVEIAQLLLGLDRAEGVFVGSGIFKSGNPAQRAAAIVKATTFHDDPDVLAQVSRGLGEAMVGINVDEIPQPHRLAERGW